MSSLSTEVAERPRLAPEQWAERMRTHERRVDALTAAHLQRRRRGVAHPVEDFLFSYYSYRPAQLRRWHPGVGVLLTGDAPHRHWRGYVPGDDAVSTAAADQARLGTVRWVRDLLARTAGRAAHFGCFGLHEWAMVYGTDDVRHGTYPLRLGSAGTDAVVEAHQVRCSHYDAFRFFTPPATARNLVQPTRDSQPELEQPGCLHAAMDLYKWSYKLSPLTPSELVADCFELARDLRVLDMRAAPYDLSSLGYEAVRIETAEGKAVYVAAQRAFADRSAPLRRRLVAVCDLALGAAGG